MGPLQRATPGPCFPRVLLTVLLLAWPPSNARADARPPSLCEAQASEAERGLAGLACQLKNQLPRLTSARVMTTALPGAEYSQQVRFGNDLSAVVASAIGASSAGLATTIHEALDTTHTPLLLLEPRLHGGSLGIRARAVMSHGGVWARARGDEPKLITQHYVQAPLDVELRSYWPPVPLVRPTPTAFEQPLAQANAIACGDVDGDGALDVALADRHRLLLGHLNESGYQTTHEARWGALSQVASVPLREPIASLFIANGSVTASSTDRESWVKLDAGLELLEASPQLFAVSPALCVARTPADGSEPGACSPGPKHASRGGFEPLDRVAVFDTQDARPLRFVARREAATSLLHVQRSTARPDDEPTASEERAQWQYASVGAQVVVSDRNLDGKVELVTSADTRVRAQDSLRLWTLPSGPGVSPTTSDWELSMPQGVDALAACPPDDLGVAALLVVSASRLFVLR